MEERRRPPEASKTLSVNEHMEAGFIALDDARFATDPAIAMRMATRATAHFEAAQAVLALAKGPVSGGVRWRG